MSSLFVTAAVKFFGRLQKVGLFFVGSTGCSVVRHIKPLLLRACVVLLRVRHTLLHLLFLLDLLDNHRLGHLPLKGR